MDKLGKIHQHHCKERLKISKIAENIAPAKLRKFTDVCMVGWGKFVPPTIQMSVKFGDLEQLYLC